MVGQGTPVQIINVVFAKNQRNVQYDWASIPRKIREHSKCLANSVLRRIGNILARPVSEKCALNADLGWWHACEHFSSCFKASPLFMRIDWLIDWIEFYTVSAISHPCDGGHDDNFFFMVSNVKVKRFRTNKEIFMWNMKTLALIIENLLAMLKFPKNGSISKVKVTG